MAFQREQFNASKKASASSGRSTGTRKSSSSAKTNYSGAGGSSVVGNSNDGEGASKISLSDNTQGVFDKIMNSSGDMSDKTASRVIYLAQLDGTINAEEAKQLRQIFGIE